MHNAKCIITKTNKTTKNLKLMTKTREIYRCTICGNVVEILNPGAPLTCCGQPMKLMK